MIYSFIRPKPKSIFKRYTKIWFVYSILAVACISGFAKILENQIISRVNEQARIEENIQHTKLKAIVLKDYIERLDYEIKLGGEIQAQNQMLKDGLVNLIGLIPDQITTKSIALDYNMLVMKGVTPTKEVYKFLLEAPLRAVFTQTKVEFYPLMSGWFNFVSVSRSNATFNHIDDKKEHSNEQ